MPKRNCRSSLRAGEPRRACSRRFDIANRNNLDISSGALEQSGKHPAGDRGNDVGPGGLLVIPPNVTHWGEVVGNEPVLNLDVFTPKRPEYAA